MTCPQFSHLFRWDIFFCLTCSCVAAGKLTVLFQSLLHDPNPNSPANNEAAQLYRENRREYEKKVAAIVQESWNEDSEEETEAAIEASK